MQASDRFNINSQLEHLQAKHVGTGHADQGRFEWAVNINRDSYASFIGHHPMLAYIAIAENESIGRERYNFMQKLGPVMRGNDEASRVTAPFHNNMPDASDTDTSETLSDTEPYHRNIPDTSDTDTSRTVSETTLTQPVRSSTRRTVMRGNDEASRVTAPFHNNMPDASDTDTSETLSDTEPYHRNIPDTSDTDTSRTVSETTLTQPVRSSTRRTVMTGNDEASRVTAPFHNNMPDASDTDTSETLSDTEPYHRNIPNTSDTDTSRTVSDSTLTQPVRSSRRRAAEAVPVDQEESSGPRKTLSHAKPSHDNILDTSDTVSDPTISQPVLSSLCRTAEAVPVDQKELSDPRKTGTDTEPYHDNILDTSGTDTSKTVSDTESYHVKITDTSDTVPDATVSKPVRSGLCGTAEAVLVDQEKSSGSIKTVSDTGPYHDNMPVTSDTDTSRTVSDIPVSQSVRSSPCRTENASPVRPPS